MLVQLVDYADQGDKVLVSVKSNELKALGYTLHTANTSAAYLTGMLAGKKAQKAGVTGEVIVDFGLQEVAFGNKLFAAVKGLLDSGLQVKVGEEVFPAEERINGEHLSGKDAGKVIEKVKASIEGMK